MIFFARCVVFSVIAVCSVLVLSPDQAAAGGSYSTSDGGGTWGAILELEVAVDNSHARFIVRKKDHLPFNIEQEAALRTGSWRGKTVTSNRIDPGSEKTELTIPLNRENELQTFYACLSNSYGHAWVGPVRLTGADEEEEYHEYSPSVEPPLEYDESDWHDDAQYRYDEYDAQDDFPTFPPEQGLSAPEISKYPYKTLLDRQISVAVLAGVCRQNGLVRVQCLASGSEHSLADPYDSGWISSGAQIMVPFTFHEAGSQIISCRTVSSCCDSEWAGRSISILHENRPPLPPAISTDPKSAELGVPVYISVRVGADPDKDQVRVTCRADDSAEVSASGWLDYPQTTEAMFIFKSPGQKEISCITADRQGRQSHPAYRTILAEKKTVNKSENVTVDRAHTQTRINISVVTNADGTADSKVRVESSRSENCTPFCKGGEITFDKPYLPHYQTEPEVIYPGMREPPYDDWPQP